MSRSDGTRLPDSTFWLDPRLREGYYSDKYFDNWVAVLDALEAEGYLFRPPQVASALQALLRSTCAWDPRLAFESQTEFEEIVDRVLRDQLSLLIGDVEVEMQVFARRKPFSIAVGVDEALATLRNMTGRTLPDGTWENTASHLRVEAVMDGDILPYEGDPTDVRPALRIRGRYRDFARLETPILGMLADPTRVATNVYNVLKASRGKTILFFPARFHHPLLQAVFGYAHKIAVERSNHDLAGKMQTFVSTDAQASWWGGEGGGTVAHACIATHLGDTAATMLSFARHTPPRVPRVALVDFHNDCIGTTLQVMRAMFAEWLQAERAGDEDCAARFKLWGVRFDTSGNMRDASVPPIGDPRVDNGVTPRLVWMARAAIDGAWREWQDLPGFADHADRAQAWCREVRIVVSGGFTPERIAEFEAARVPVDVYGVGTYLLSNCARCGTNNDFTADVVRVRVADRWVPLSKVGRRPCDNPDLRPVEF